MRRSRSSGLRLYCGRRVGRSGYHDGPLRWPGHAEGQCTCDGTCGPSDGCQCRECYNASFPEERTQGAEGRRYCGRRIGRSAYHNGSQRCRGHTDDTCSCNGICGPGDGCQCATCYLETFPESQRLGAEGRKYCGRRIGPEGYHDGPESWCNRLGISCTCTGFCGPIMGCQCRACYFATFANAVDSSSDSLLTPIPAEAVAFDAGEASRVAENVANAVSSATDIAAYPPPPVANFHEVQRSSQSPRSPRSQFRGFEGRMYCGRRIGHESYHDGPLRWRGHSGRCDCNGTCGPANGCQCRDCYLASFPDGRTQGEYGRYYCGRRVGRESYHSGARRWQGHTNENCTCDGACGPSSGCQCRDCYLATFPASHSSTRSSSLVAGVEDEEPTLDSESVPTGIPGHKCVVCYVAAVNVCLVPCGHVCVCTVCGDRLHGQRCPICRQDIAQVVRIYLSGLPCP